MQRRIVLLAAIFLGVGAIVRGWDAGAAFALSLLVPSVIGVIDYRICILLGLGCIASCPVLLIVNGNTWIEPSPSVNYAVVSHIGRFWFNPGRMVDSMSIQAYYFLIVSVVASMGRALVNTVRKAT